MKDVLIAAIPGLMTIGANAVANAGGEENLRAVDKQSKLGKKAALNREYMEKALKLSADGELGYQETRRLMSMARRNEHE